MSECIEVIQTICRIDSRSSRRSARNGFNDITIETVVGSAIIKYQCSTSRSICCFNSYILKTNPIRPIKVNCIIHGRRSTKAYCYISTIKGTTLESNGSRICRTRNRYKVNLFVIETRSNTEYNMGINSTILSRHYSRLDIRIVSCSSTNSISTTKRTSTTNQSNL